LNYLIDLDGVIYRGEQVIEGAVETLAWLRLQRAEISFLTNNSAFSRRNYLERLSLLGIKCQLEEIMSTAYATRLYLEEKGPPGARVLVIGEWGLMVELEGAKVSLVDWQNEGLIDYVVVGLDRNFHYSKLTRAHHAIIQGAKFIATNRDATFPTEKGTLPGGGAIVAAIEACTGKTPVVIGKPQDYMVKKVLETRNWKSEETVVVGDRLETDVLLGNQLGMITALVLTGITNRETAEKAVHDLKPTYILDSIQNLKELSFKKDGSI